MAHPGTDIVLFATGGTIASASGDKQPGALIRLTGDDLLRSVPGLEALPPVSARSLRQVPSGDLTTHDVLALAAEIRSAVRDGARGIVVTQGTDTLEEVAFILDLLVDTDVPIVLTGAMRTSGQPGADGPANIVAAVKVAASAAARGLGAVVVFNDEIHAARFVRKRSTTSTATFGSPLTGPLGMVVEDRVLIFLRVPGRLIVELPEPAKKARVAMLPIAFDDDGELLDAETLGHYDGVVVAAFGAGHVPHRIVARLAALSERMPVVIASRTFGGDMLRSTYGYPGGEMDLLAHGLTFAGAYDAVHARVLLQLLLMAGAGRETIASAFARGLVTEERMVLKAS